MTTAALVAGQHGGPEALLRRGRDRDDVRRSRRGGGRAAGRPELRDRRRRDGRQRARRASRRRASSRSPARATSASQISEKAGRVVPGQIWIKRAILEMGGKDFILVDETADLEEAANGIVAAAFGFQGQKCSACSRLIVHADGAQGAPRPGRREDEGPLGRRRARSEEHGRRRHQRRARRRRSSTTSRSARRKAGSWRAARPGPKQGFFVMPTVVDDIKPTARLAREEIFGPVLAVLKVRRLRRGHPCRQRHRVRPDRVALLARPGAAGPRQARALRRATST